MTRIEQIRERLAKATPGSPYSSSNPTGYYVNGKCIVSPADLAWLLSRLEAAEGVVQSAVRLFDATAHTSLRNSPEASALLADLAKWEQGT